jgi:hypothetical protein
MLRYCVLLHHRLAHLLELFFVKSVLERRKELALFFLDVTLNHCLQLGDHPRFRIDNLLFSFGVKRQILGDLTKNRRGAARIFLVLFEKLLDDTVVVLKQLEDVITLPPPLCLTSVTFRGCSSLGLGREIFSWH